MATFSSSLVTLMDLERGCFIGKDLWQPFSLSWQHLRFFKDSDLQAFTATIFLFLGNTERLPDDWLVFSSILFVSFFYYVSLCLYIFFFLLFHALLDVWKSFYSLVLSHTQNHSTSCVQEGSRALEEDQSSLVVASDQVVLSY